MKYFWFSAASAAVVGLCFLFIGCRPNPTGGVKVSLVICSWGGGYQESQEQAFFRPFEEETEITIVRARPWSGEYALLTSPESDWDLVLVEEPTLFRAARENLLREIPAEVSRVDGVIPDLTHPRGVPADTFSTGIAWKEGGGVPPKTWAEFWDVEKFPGSRSLRDNPRYALEFALLSDGVSPDKLYPLDVDRAFRRLDAIKPHIRKWWKSGAEHVELLASGEVNYASAWSGRVFNARRKGTPLAMSLRGAVVEPEYWAIPARRQMSAEKVAAVHKFLQFYLRPDRQAEMTKLYGVSPVNQKAIELVPSDIRAQLVTTPENLAIQVRARSAWWAEHEKEVEDRFQEWRLK